MSTEAQREYAKAYYLANREKILGQSKKNYEANRERYAGTRRAWNLRSRYGITVEDRAAMLSEQSGRCAICGIAEGDTNENVLYVDHDHDTGRVRGLLCGNCNKAIGLLKESSFALESAIVYLTRAA